MSNEYGDGFVNIADLKDGHTLTVGRQIDDAVEKSRAALQPTVRMINGWESDGTLELARQLFDRVVERYQHPGGFRSVVNDYVPGDYFVSLTDCPYAYIALEAADLGIANVKDLLMDDEDDDEARASSEALLSKVAVR